jgi:spermidine synthase
MYKYDGLVIYQNHDDEGILEVVEKRGVRSLHFGSSAKQSSLSLDDPETLQLPYVRAMASWMLFKEQLESVLMIGLGGGTLARFLIYHFPEVRIRAVEYRSSVLKIARSHFGLPMDARLKVIIDDGDHYVRQQAITSEDQHDLILIDAFDVEGMSGSVASIAFFDACKSLLKPEGLLVMNLWGSESHLSDSCLAWLKGVFADKVISLPVRHRGNIIAIAFNQISQRYDLKLLQQRAKYLEQHFQIEFPVFLKDINKHNTFAIHNVINK